MRLSVLWLAWQTVPRWMDGECTGREAGVDVGLLLGVGPVVLGLVQQHFDVGPCRDWAICNHLRGVLAAGPPLRVLHDSVGFLPGRAHDQRRSRRCR